MFAVQPTIDVYIKIKHAQVGLVHLLINYRNCTHGRIYDWSKLLW